MTVQFTPAEIEIAKQIQNLASKKDMDGAYEIWKQHPELFPKLPQLEKIFKAWLSVKTKIENW